MPTEKPEYLDHAGILHERCSSFHRSTGVDPDELASVGRSVFVKATETWDPERSKFSTYFYVRLTNAFIDHCRKNPLTIEDAEEQVGRLFNHHPEWHPRRALMAKERIQSLSLEAQQVVHTLLTAPSELFGLDGTESQKQAKGQIIFTLKTWGWAHREVRRVMRELHCLGVRISRAS